MSVASTVQDLEDRVAMLEQALGMDYDGPPEWGLTPYEARVMGMLRKTPVARLDRLVTALSAHRDDGGSSGSVAVMISRIRRKTGYKIANIKGVGYALRPH